MVRRWLVLATLGVLACTAAGEPECACPTSITIRATGDTPDALLQARS